MKELGIKRIILGIILLSTILMTLILYEEDKISVQKTFEYIQEDGYLGLIIFTILMTLAGIVAFPIVIFMIGGGLLFGPLVGFILVSTGLLLGAIFSFLISRYLFHDFFHKKFAHHKLLQWTKITNQEQLFTIGIITRIFPFFPYSVLNYGWALTKISLRTFTLSTLIGDIPGTFVYVYLGSAITDVTSVKFYISLALLIAFTILAYKMKHMIKLKKSGEVDIKEE